eukprot:scaffold7384_cov396-Prasinococcus_capsulatus_cf.AAC.2
MPGGRLRARRSRWGGARRLGLTPHVQLALVRRLDARPRLGASRRRPSCRWDRAGVVVQAGQP